MLDFDGNEIHGDDEESGEPISSGSQTDRVNGEYHYKNGYTQKIYSDAHYVREEENTVPPKYYTPPEKPPKETREPRPKGTGGGIIKLVCLCLVCALLGGFGGAALVGARLNDRVDAVQQSLSDMQAQQELETGSAGTGVTAQLLADGSVPASQIYDDACKQVVGITTEVTYTNFFGMTSSSAVTGSGFIISADGYIITNFHVIENAYNDDLDVTVMLHDGTSYTATIVGVESDNDVAVLKIDANGLTAAQFGDSDSLKVGDTVYAVGNPLGELEFSMSTGHLSALDRFITADDSSAGINMFQMDTAVNPGNSGGPVYNNRGQVVGVVTAKYSSTGVEGIGFAVPINDAAAIANDLITKGYVTGKAHMGVELDSRYNSMYSQYYGMPLGAYVYSVVKGSAAAEAGIQAGDIIIRLGDDEVSSDTELRSAVKRHSAGDTVELEFYRAGENKTTEITFDEAKPDDADN